MREDELIFNAIEQTRKSDNKSALATIVNVKGSAYRREGAKMFIHENDHVIGMLSGGCLEADVIEEARAVMRSGEPLLKTYELDEALVWGLGLGCPGTVKIYIEPIYSFREEKMAEQLNSPFEMWLRNMKEEKEGILATVLPDHKFKNGNKNQGRFFISRENGDFGDLGDENLNLQVRKIAKNKLAEENSHSETCLLMLPSGEEMNVFLDVYLPPAEIMIFGAGHDAVPVAKYAVSLGFKTTIVDEREAYNNEERFPHTERLIISKSEFHEKLTIGQRTYIIVMNHHLEKDSETLKFALPSKSPYIGVLGPYKRRTKILAAIKEEGISYGEWELKRLYSPIGLNIGAVTPEEIAISVIAEVIAKKNGYTGGFLQGSECIHHPKRNRLLV